MNSRIPEFRDLGGLNSSPAQLEALQEAQSLAYQSVPPPTDFQLMVRASLGRLLPVYGDSLFRRQVPSTFAPIRNANVTPDYVLGPGDQLIIRIWGQVDFNAQLTVDRSGAVYLPQVGEIHVAGLPYSQVQQHIRDAVSHIYKSFNLEVEMGQLRSIQVFVVGQARRPGTYTLSSLSTLVTALFATGGPSVQGSLRDIQLRRNGQTVSHFDLYDLLIFGDMSKDAPAASRRRDLHPSRWTASSDSRRGPRSRHLRTERSHFRGAGSAVCRRPLFHCVSVARVAGKAGCPYQPHRHRCVAAGCRDWRPPSRPPTFSACCPSLRSSRTP